MTALAGEILENRDGTWRTVHLGHTVRVTDHRRVKPGGPYAWTRRQHHASTDPLGLSPAQRAASNHAQTVREFARSLDMTLDPWQEALVNAVYR